MLTPDEKKKVYDSRKKNRKYHFVSSRAFSIGTRMTRQLTSQHTDGLFGSRRRGAPLDRVIRIVIVSLANFVTFVWFVRRSRRASFADEVEEERVRLFVHHRVRRGRLRPRTRVASFTWSQSGVR